MKLKLKPIIALALLVCSAALNAKGDYISTVVSQGPVVFLPLNETNAPPPPVMATNLGTLSTNFNGIYTNDPPRGLSGPLTGGNGSAVSFDGSSQSVITPYNASLNPSSFTVEAWLNPKSSSVSGGLLCALASMYSGTPRQGWLIYQSDTVTNGGVGQGFDLRLYNTNGSAFSTSLLAATNITGGGWYHVVASYNSTNNLASVYVNGTPLGTATPALNAAGLGFVPNTSAPFTIGVRSDNGFYWPGKASEVAYYSYVLTPAQVLAHYNAAAGGSTYPTVIEGAGPIVYDRLNEPGEPTAVNLGTLGSAANATYVYAASPGQPGPQSPAYPGFSSTNKGVGINGSSGYVKVPPLNLNSANVTMTAWVNLAANNSPNAGIVFSDSGATQAGLKFDVSNPNGLSYNWSSDVAANYDSTLTIPSSPQWAFIALITYPDHAVLCLQDGNSFQFVTNLTTLGALPFAGVTLIGSDGGASTLTMNGTISDVAIFNRSLGLGEVYAEYSAADGTNPPVIFQGPVPPANALYVGDTLSLTVDGGGTPPYTYQWLSNNIPIHGATTDAYTIAGVVVPDSANYSVVITNAYGSATSAVAAITVNALATPVITLNPVGRTLYAGGTISLSGAASGGDLTYQWQKNTIPIAGATSSTFVIPSAVSTNTGSYALFVSNSLGTATSVAAAITVLTPAVGSYESVVLTNTPEAWWRLNDPSGSSVMSDSMGRHDGTYSGGVTLGVPGLPFSSTTAATFDGNNGTYGLVPYNAILNSEVFTVEAWVQTEVLGTEMGVFSSYSTESSSPYKGKGEFLQLTTGDVFQGGIGLNDTYAYYYVDMGTGITNKWTQVVVTYGAGGLSYYQDGQLSSGGYGDFVRNTSSPFYIGTVLPFIDDWYWNGQIADVSYYTTNLSAAQINAQYQAALYGTSTKPVFITQPQPETVVVSNNASFSATVQGSLPISLQWLFNGSPISGATNSTLSLTNVFYTAEGNYVLRATNSAGASNSVAAVLTILAPPDYVNATNALVLHLNFDGNYNDSSGQGNNGTPEGSPTFVTGKIGSGALHYSTFTATGASGGTVTAANYVSLGVVPDLEFGTTNDFSVSFWIRVASNTVSGDLPFFGNTVGSTYGFGYLFAPSYDAGGWAWSLGNSGAPTGSIEAQGANNSINDGQWHNLVFTFDRQGNGTAYQDGGLANTTSIIGIGDIDSGSATTIGQDPTGTYTEPGAADIDDVGVWTRVLSPYEAYAINYVGASHGRTFDTFGPVHLTLQPYGSGYAIVWQAGTLQSAPTLNGPWTPVAGASAPFYSFTPGAGNKFYRVKLQ